MNRKEFNLKELKLTRKDVLYPCCLRFSILTDESVGAEDIVDQLNDSLIYGGERDKGNIMSSLTVVPLDRADDPEEPEISDAELTTGDKEEGYMVYLHSVEEGKDYKSTEGGFWCGRHMGPADLYCMMQSPEVASLAHLHIDAEPYSESQTIPWDRTAFISKEDAAIFGDPDEDGIIQTKVFFPAGNASEWIAVFHPATRFDKDYAVLNSFLFNPPPVIEGPHTRIMVNEERYRENVNFVDTNNKVVGYDLSQSCCEDATWTILDSEWNDLCPREDDNRKSVLEPPPDFKDGTPEVLVGYTFSGKYVRDADEGFKWAGGSEYGYDGGGAVAFELIKEGDTDGSQTRWLLLENYHNGYYAHGFDFKDGDTVILSDVL